jgi:hypothetical protein
VLATFVEQKKSTMKSFFRQISLLAVGVITTVGVSAQSWQTAGSNLYFSDMIGIGTNDVQARLSIRTNASYQGLIIGNVDTQSAQTHLGFTTANQSKIGLSSESFLQFYNNGKWNLNSGNSGGTTLPISFNTNGVSRIFVGTNGNVGIGSVNPDATLAVKGIVHANEVRVDLSVPGPDYVFEPDYKLPTLESIKSYIQSNKHLPEVPSAEQMKADGVQVGEMNMILLKKVEELTLYVIELKEENEKIKRSNAAQDELLHQLSQKK